MAKELKKRSEVNEKDTWAITDLYATDDAWRAEFEEAKKFKEELKKFKGTLGSSAETLYAYYSYVDQISLVLDNLVSYAARRRDEDTKNSTYQAMYGSILSLYVEIEGASAFELPEVIAIPDEVMEQFYKEKEELNLYKLHITRKRSKKAHTLSEAEEKLLAAAGEVAGTPTNVFGMLNNADLVFPEITDEEGNKVRLTHGNFIPFMESADREVRKAAFKGLYSVYEQFKNTLASVLNGQVKQLMFFANARNYNSTLEAALDKTEVPVAVYKNLIEAVHANLPSLHRYVELRKKLLGVDELHMYDLYTPVVKDVDVKIPFEKAKETVYEALAPLGEEYRSILKQGFENRWIDVYENEGKRSGAYSSGSKVHPFVLLNHADTLDSEFTLAHEMGHALHSYLSNQTQPTVYSEYTIFVAEVASTCNEAILMKYLLSKTTDKMEKAYLINHFLEKFRGTLFRQTMFAEFELKINELAESGESLTAETLCALYHDLNVQYFGNDIVIDKEIDVEWARIPHFYYNFYVFQYATGYSAAIALSERILNGGEEAVKDYLKFLSSGSSQDPISLLKIAGVDMSSPEPVNAALRVFDSLIQEMEELLAE
ncbi:MAG: oligoendopeptidase F [Lachnospiraceae bacterium]|nr:oligoendopeptidase F [Lachnospiraceae bacterium]